MHATTGAWRPTPTQSTCLYYCHGNEASKCVCHCVLLQRLLKLIHLGWRRGGPVASFTMGRFRTEEEQNRQ